MADLSPLKTRELDEEEWQNSWKEHFDVLHVGKRIVIKPTWRDYESTDDDVVIALDPGMAFGTGHHPTTRMCLELIEEHVAPGMDVFDLGCGSGILSIAAAKLGTFTFSSASSLLKASWPRGATVNPFFLARSRKASEFAAFAMASARIFLISFGVFGGTERPRNRSSEAL